MVAVSSWGSMLREEHDVHMLTNRDTPLFSNDQLGIAYGLGKSYGDVCLNPGGVLWNTTRLDRFIQFDAVTGVLACEAGVLLSDIQRLTMPSGWMLPVTPGTQLITVGGAIANDVHGKNHHVYGSFGDHVTQLSLARSDGTLMQCGPHGQTDWFSATVGGLGLTGVITQAEFQLRRFASPWLNTETIPYHSLQEFFDLADASEEGWEHTVSWVDCTGKKNVRGIFMRANPVTEPMSNDCSARSGSMPFMPPVSLVNRFSLKLFNTVYFNRHKLSERIMHHDRFSYPLDSVSHWNRIYGPKGFYQYQCVIPRESGYDAVASLLNEIAKSGQGSFLTVLKTFGNRESIGMLSFPRPGVTLALDFPNQGEKTLALFAKLDDIVQAAGGRLYAAKDARMPRDLFEAGYPQLNTFNQYRDPGMSSALSRRLLGS